jgi:hypothetical protein
VAIRKDKIKTTDGAGLIAVLMVLMVLTDQVILTQVPGLDRLCLIRRCRLLRFNRCRRLRRHLTRLITVVINNRFPLTSVAAW